MNKILGFALIFVLIVGVSVWWAWHKQKNTVPEMNGLPADFTEFYQKFHTDSIFQMQHIQFPLEGLPNAADSSAIGNFHWQRENWVMHRIIPDTSFERAYRMPLDNMVEESIYTKGQFRFGVIRRFMKLEKDWSLIYYASSNPIK